MVHSSGSLALGVLALLVPCLAAQQQAEVPGTEGGAYFGKRPPGRAPQIAPVVGVNSSQKGATRPGANQREAPAVGLRAHPIVCGRYISHQLNVDSSGNDRLGDAANEPSIALDPTDSDRILVGWRQIDNRDEMLRQGGYAFSSDGGVSWRTGVLAPGELVSDPVVRADARGRFYYLGLGRTLRLWRSDDGGTTWLPPVTVRGARDKPWLALHGESVAIAWEGMSKPQCLTWSHDRGDTFAAPVSVPLGPLYGTIVFDCNGTLLIAGDGRDDTGSFVVARAVPEQEPQSVRVDLGGFMGINLAPSPRGLLGQVQVVVDPARADHVYVLCSVDPEGPDPADVHLVRSTDGGATFGEPIRVNPDPADEHAWQWFGTVAIAPDGRLDVVWNDTSASGHARWSRTVHSFSDDSGMSWSKPAALTPKWDSHAGQPVQRKIGDYYDLVSTDTAAHLAFAATFRGGQDVYYLRIERE